MSHHDASHETHELSPAGQARRAAMLAPLQRAVTARARRRLAARAAIIAAPVLALSITALVLFRSPRPAPLPAPIAHDPAPSVTTPPHLPSLAIDTPADGPAPDLAAPDLASWSIIPHARPAAVTLIRAARADPDLLARSRYQGNPTVPTASDDDLVAALRASGRTDGLVRTPTQVRLVRAAPDPAPAS